jgi:hypothetical protein
MLLILRTTDGAPAASAFQAHELEAHLAWVRGAATGRIEREGLDLRGADLRGLNLCAARVAGCDLTGADLRGATLAQAELVDCDLTDADLTAADLSDAQIEGGSLVRALLAETNLVNARATRCDWTEAFFWETWLAGALIDGDEVVDLSRPGRDRLTAVVVASPGVPPRMPEPSTRWLGATRTHGWSLHGSTAAWNALRGRLPPQPPPEDLQGLLMQIDHWTSPTRWGEFGLTTWSDLPLWEPAPDLERRCRGRIHAPRIEARGPNRVLVRWIVDSAVLIRRELSLSAQGQVERTDEALGRLPMHEGKGWGEDLGRWVPIA